MITQTVIIILTGVTAVAALLAAGGAWWSAVVTKRTAQGQLSASLLYDYSSKDMLDALKRLLNLWYMKDQGGDFYSWLEEWKELRKSIKTGNHRIDDARHIDEARRRVSHYFFTALELYENKKCINRGFLEVICKGKGFERLYQVVEDLEQAINADYDRSQFDRLLKFHSGTEREKQQLERARPRVER